MQTSRPAGLELQRRDHALVAEGACRQRDEICAELGATALAEPVGAAIQRDSRQRRGVTDRGTRNKQLLEGRARLKRELAEVLLVGGDFTPAEDLEVLACRDALDASLLLGPSFVIQGKEDHARRVLPHRRQAEVHDSAKEGIRHLREDAGAVASTGIRPDCTPVLKVAKGGQSEVDDVVTGLPTKGRDEKTIPADVLTQRPLA